MESPSRPQIPPQQGDDHDESQQPAATTASSPSSSPAAAAAAAAAASPIPSRPQSPDLPLTMTASAVLTALPRDALRAAASALSSAGADDDDEGAPRKVVVRFKPVGSAPPVRREVCKISAGQKFEAVVAYLRRVLRVGAGESVFLYVNSTFAPALDEVVGNLHRCFKDSKDQLNVAYSMTPAFG